MKSKNDLNEQLTWLKLLFMQGHFEDLARQAAEGSWSHVEYLNRLVAGEVAARQDRARLRRIRDARFPVLKTLDQFDFTWPTKINRLQVQNLFRLQFIEEKANVILVGGVGQAIWPSPWATPPVKPASTSASPPPWTPSTPSRPPMPPAASSASCASISARRCW
jgi:hypothetical protein